MNERGPPPRLAGARHARVPSAVHPNNMRRLHACRAMYESDAIIEYLFKTYGNGQVPLGLRLGFLTALSCGLAMLPR